MIRYAFFSALILSPLVMACASVDSPSAKSIDQNLSVEGMLRDLAADYADDPTATTETFGFDVDGDKFTVIVNAQESPPHDVKFITGFPEQPILYWKLSKPDLVRAYEGMNADTLTARTRNEDPVSLNLATTEGYDSSKIPTDEMQNYFERWKIHFFARGRPEVIRFGNPYTTTSHGGTISSIYNYPNEFLLFWLGLEPGQHVNEEDDVKANPFQTIIMVYSGTGMAKFGGKEMPLEAGNAYLIPAGMDHELWNPSDAVMEGFVFIHTGILDEAVMQQLMEKMNAAASARAEKQQP